VQSDWHQAGKRRGYDNAERATEIDGIKKQLTKLTDEWDTLDRTAPRRGNIAEEMNVLNDRLRAMDSDFAGVPDAPFKTTWPDLAMKRIIREAAEKGYDKVAWTPGSVQADRYDLSKQVSKINAYRVRNAGEPVLKDGQPQYRVQAHDKDGRLALDQYVVERDLPDTIGKDLADKIIKARDGAHDYSGLDLKIGGEGMKGFYDQILPAAVNKIVKKAGGRVGQSEINAGGKLLNETEAMPGRPVDVRRSERGGGYTIALDGSDTTWGLFNDEHAARARMSALQEAWDKAKTPVHTLDITPQLREMALKKGFPLFTAGGLVAGGAMGDLAKQDDYQ
jgi:hypothetical protein